MNPRSPDCELDALIFLEMILFVLLEVIYLLLEMILGVWCCTPDSERSPANINCSLILNLLKDLNLLSYRKQSCNKTETLTSTSWLKNRNFWAIISRVC